MTTVGKVESLWRYPVKSMRGEALEEAFVGFSGLYGDRVFAFTSTAAPKGFPFFTGREQSEMLRYRPRFRDPVSASRPTNLAEASSIGSGVTPTFAGARELTVDVETPSGASLAVDDPALIAMLTENLGATHELTLSQSHRSMTDCRPVSLMSIQTVRQLGNEIEAEIDKRRFRANIYINLESGDGFGEDAFIGRSCRIGEKAVVSILQRDGRCKMITLDPDTGESSPNLLRTVAKAHDGMAGVYGAVLVEGLIRPGDPIVVLS